MFSQSDHDQAADANKYLPDQSYTLSTRELCLRLTRAHIDLSKALDILPTLTVSSADPDLPSWTPNWFLKDTWRALADSRHFLHNDALGLKRPNTQTWNRRPVAQRHWSLQKFGEIRSLDFDPRPPAVSWSAHDHTPARCEPEGPRKDLLRVYGLSLSTIYSVSGPLGESSRDPGHSQPSQFSSQPMRTLSIHGPDHLRTRRQLWQALVFLMTLRYASVRHVQTNRSKQSNPVERAFWRAVRYIRGSAGLFYVLGDALLLRHSLKQVRKWRRQNADFAIFETTLSSGTRLPLVCLVDTTGFRLFILISCCVITIAIVSVYHDSGELGGKGFFAALGVTVPILVLSAGISFVEVIFNLVSVCTALPRAKRIKSIEGLNMRLAWGDFGVGWVHARARPGDSIVILMGCSVPLVLRPRPEGEGWTFVGDAVVAGAMKGEMMDEAKCDYIDIY